MDYCFEAEVRGIICFNMGLTLREGDREYFYSKLDALFPGLKDRYIKTFGNSYSCLSPENERLMSILATRAVRTASYIAQMRCLIISAI